MFNLKCKVLISILHKRRLWYIGRLPRSSPLYTVLPSCLELLDDILPMELIALSPAPCYFWFNCPVVWPAVDDVLPVAALLLSIFSFGAGCFLNSIPFSSYKFLTNTLWHFLQKEPFRAQCKVSCDQNPLASTADRSGFHTCHMLQQSWDRNVHWKMNLYMWGRRDDKSDWKKRNWVSVFSGNYSLTSGYWNISIDFMAFSLQIYLT